MGNPFGSLLNYSVRLPVMVAGTAFAAGGAVSMAAQSLAWSRLAEPQGLAIGAAALGGVALLSWLVGRSVVKPLAALRDAVAGLAEGGEAAMPGVERRDEFGDLARSLATVRVSAVEASRIRAALDSCHTNLMVCDTDDRVVYANAALLKFFADAQDDFRAAFPGASAKELLGKVMQVVRGEAARSGAPARGGLRLALGRRTVALTVTPMRAGNGDSLGTAVEWLELTEELAAGTEVADMASAAADGDFSRRASLKGKPETLARIAEGMNSINALVEQVVGELASVLGGLAQGDLTQRMRGQYHGRFAELQDSLNGALEHLGETVATIQATAGQVGHAASEINAGAGDLATRTEQTAVNLEETAATTEELAVSVKQSAERSRRAMELAGEAMSMAGEGRSVVTQTVDAIERIEQSSSRISEIVSVIDEIAFQTNLLALNAAVEAARAGDAGKGFAVVASEVRSLAQRSSQAAKGIKDLIVTSKEQVGEGVRFVRSTGEALDRIVVAAGQVSATITEITMSTTEQAHGIGAMSLSVAQMDETTQANSVLAEQSAASASDLIDQIAMLTELVAAFQTDVAPVQPRFAQPRMPAPAPVPAIEAKRPAPTRRAETPRPSLAAAQRAEPRRRTASSGRADAWAEF